MPSNQNLIGQKFGLLTVIDFAPDKQYNGYKKTQWKCQCDCGAITIARTNAIKSGNTQSCGCMYDISRPTNGKNSAKKRVKLLPHIFSAKEIWHATYRDGSLSFDDFYQLSQCNCYYCNIEPSRSYNYFGKKKSSKSYLQNVDDGIFIYNGLDRIDSSRLHDLDNVIPCCTICNRAKSNHNIYNFVQYINNLKNTVNINFIEYNDYANVIDIASIATKSLYKISVKCVFSGNYNDGDLTLEQFYQLSQMNCFYCGCKPSNKSNKIATTKTYSHLSQDIINSALFIYNGLDRIDSNKLHTLDNVVACCKQCNWAKDHLSFDEFMQWKNRITNNLETLNNKINIGV